MFKFLILAIFMVSSTVITVIQFQRNFVSAAELPVNMPAVILEPALINDTSPGETFVLSVKLFNLSDSFYPTNTEWERGDDLGPWVSASPIHNYSLGNLAGLDIQVGWDETVLKFVSNVTKIPVEKYPDGVLHEPIFKIMDNVSETHSFPWPQPKESKYWLSYLNLVGALGKPYNGNGTVLEITFEVLKEGASNLTLTRTQLSDRDAMDIPHKCLSSFFRSPGARTRLAKVQVGSIVDEEFLEPTMTGEDVNISIQVRNDGDVSDSYNLTLYYDDEQVQNGAWIEQTLDPLESAFYTYTLTSAGLGRGTHNIRADLSIVHEGELVSDTDTKQFRVIDPPQLAINGPTTIESGQTVQFDASQSSHSDPDGTILNYTWALWAPGETIARHSYEGVTFTHKFPGDAKNGTWRIVLSVKDSFGVTYSEFRPLSSPYLTEVTLQVNRAVKGIPWDLIVLGVILIAIIAVAVFYIRRRRR